MIMELPVTLYGVQATLAVEYTENTSPLESGFDALSLPFPADKCVGYPTLHAYFEDMRLRGYRRYCGFIQLIDEDRRIGDERRHDVQLDVSEAFLAMGNPYFSYGYPAELYDAPCLNIGSSDELCWRAYTYLVEPPSRLNGDQLICRAGFRWGYIENQQGLVRLLPLETVDSAQFEAHKGFMKRY